MGKRLTTDQSFNCYTLTKAAAQISDNHKLWNFLEDFFLEQMDYDLWEEGQEGAQYRYPWGVENTKYLKEMDVTRKGTRIFYLGKEVEIKGRDIYYDGKRFDECHF